MDAVANGTACQKMLYSGETASNYLFVEFSQGLANNDMTDAERAALDPNSAEFTQR
jgi:hypothetical protein